MGSKKVEIGIAVLVVLAVVLVFPLRKVFRDRQWDSKAPTFDGDSTKLTQTVILPAFASPMVPGKNNIWCSSFQLAWNELKNIFKGPIVAKGAEGLSQMLNTAGQSSADLEKGSYYVAADMGKNGIVKKILSDMARLFPGVPLPKFRQDPDIVVYSYLQAYLKFRQPFEVVDWPLTFIDSTGKQTQVKSFGIWKSHGETRSRLKEQVHLLYYSADKNQKIVEFALDLCRFTQPYQVVVAMVEPKATLQQTYEVVQDNIRQFRGESIQPGESLAVPELFWQINHQFAELIGLPINRDYGIDEAYQTMRFRLDRSGVILESKAKIVAKSASAKPDLRRSFMFNKPFLIYLKKRDAQQPFFVMWVDNAELLTPK